MADSDDDRDEDDRKSKQREPREPRAERLERIERDDAIAPRPLEPATLTIPISPPRADKKLGKDKDAVRFVGKLGKKEKKQRKDAIRALDSWERYRALTDAVDEANDLVDLADHKARFALVIMAAVNVVLFFTADAMDPLKSKSFVLQIVLGIYLFFYILIALYFFLQAIESLRPRKSKPQVAPVDEAGIEEFPLGIRFYEDILRRDVDAYKKAWQEVRIGQLNAELAVQAHALAEINKAKYGALRRLYKGLQIMLLMAVGLVALGGVASLVGTAKKASKTMRGEDVLGAAERIAHTGVKEPSGVAFHPGLGHMFVVGDDGTLSELDGAGKNIRTLKVEPQIEDVVYHPPSGGLLLVSEKKAELILFDPVAGKERRRWKMDTAALLQSTVPLEANQGFEGLAFKPDPSRPGGGIIYLSHQRAPAAVIGVAFDTASSATIDASAVVSRWIITSYDDLTAISYVPSIDRVIAIADSQDRLIVLGPDGTVENEVPIPGEQQEGLVFDGQGALWIADDKDKSVLKLPGGLAGLEAHLRGAATPSPAAADDSSLPGGILANTKAKNPLK
jgi:uncharacterized protein YjiK